MPKKKKAGRKPVADKIILLRVYVHESKVNKLGYENAQELAKKAVERAAERIS